MRAIVLGAAAGGGSPQWNCRCTLCSQARAAVPEVPPRSQCALAVSADGATWVLLNASPDLRQQIDHTPELQPAHGLRSSPIAAVVLTSGEVDAIAGLLTMRERQAFAVLATAQVLQILDDNPIFDVLARDVVRRERLQLDRAHAVTLPDGAPCGLRVLPFAVPGKVPLYLERGADPAAVETDQTIGVQVTDGTASLFFIPGCAAMTPELAERLRGADAVLFDGTLWADDEMIVAGMSGKTGRRMGHMSVSGADGTLAAFDGLDVRQRILVHMNNSNPILHAGSPERRAAEAAGWVVAHDGMELRL